MAEYTVFEQGLQILEAWDEVGIIHSDTSLSQLEEIIRQDDLRKIAVFLKH